MFHDPLVAMMRRGQTPMVGAANAPGQYHPYAALFPYGGVAEMPPGIAAVPPGLPPAVSTGPNGCPPPYGNPCMPYGPMAPAPGWSAFNSPQALARGMRAAMASNIPGKGLGFRTVAGAPVAANTAGVVLLTAAASQPMCPRTLRWHETSAPFFLVSSIFVSGREWLVAGGSVPATNFTGESICCLPMEFPTVFPGVQISTTVENIDGAPHATFGTYNGPVADSVPCM